MISTAAIKEQNFSDLVTVVKVMGALVKEDMLDEEELRRLRYCTKIVKQVTKKQLLLNSKHK